MPATETPPSIHAVDCHVGARVRLRRRAVGMSQAQLAQAIGVTFQQVQKYEQGTNRISASKLFEIARTLGTSVAYYFDGLPGGSASAAGLEAEASLQAFLQTPDGLELSAIFPRLAGRQRRRILELVRTLTDPE